MLTPSHADAILVTAFTPRLASASFTCVGKRTWARTGKPHIYELVRLCHTKGAGITPIWGVALDFVPQVSGSGLKWKRSPRDLYFDLEWSPVDYDEACRAEANASHERLMEAARTGILEARPKGKASAADKWFVSRLDAEDVFVRRAAGLAELTAAEAVPFLNRIRNLNSVGGLLAFQSSYSYKGLGFFNHVQPPLAHAFLLARQGRTSEAGSAYKTYCDKITVPEAVRPKLDAAFQDALASPLPTPASAT